MGLNSRRLYNRGIIRRFRSRWMVAVSTLLTFLLAAPLAGQSISTIAGGGTDDGRLAVEIFVYGIRGVVLHGSDIVFSESIGRVRRIDGQTGRVTTIAGIGAEGFRGDGGPAHAAALSQPSGLAYDRAGNLYIADSNNDRVRRVDATTGIITTIAGGKPDTGAEIGDGGPARDAFLASPFGLLIIGNTLYVTESGYRGNRVRRIDLASGRIDTIAGAPDGSSGFSGDGGLATAALLNTPRGIAADPAGDLFVADTVNDRIRRIDGTGRITTFAGGGKNTQSGASLLDAALGVPVGLGIDSKGNVYFSSVELGVRKIDRAAGVITQISVGYLPIGLTVDGQGNVYHSVDDPPLLQKVAPDGTVTRIAGGSGYIGEGVRGTAAILRAPRALALDRAGNLYIGDFGHRRVRRLDPQGVITTVAGNGSAYVDGSQTGEDAVSATVGGIADLAFDSAGNLYIADYNYNFRVWRVDVNGKISSYAGGGPEQNTGDGIPATDARIYPRALAFDAADNLYIADSNEYRGDRHRIRRVDARTKEITTVVGAGPPGYTGDNGPAASATLKNPTGLVFDARGALFIASANNVIRRVSGGIITTYAGGGSSLEDGVAAADARLDAWHLAIDLQSGDLYFTDVESHRVRKIEATTKLVTTVAGSGRRRDDADFSGDNGRATEARLNLRDESGGVALDALRNVYLSDTNNNRVRVVYACRSVNSPQLSAPGDAVTGQSTAPTLTWTEPAGAFRYDVFLDTVPDPQRLVASDTDETTFTPSNLAPNTKYYWKVRAKGDPFCDPISTATSPVRSFTTTARCGVGTFELSSPAEGATNVDPVVLSWQGAAGAGSYDVYFGNVNPPPLHTAGVTGTSLTVTARSGVHYWTVVAHAACDPRQTSTAAVRSFTPRSTGGCTGGASVTLLAPGDAATEVATSTDLSWRADGCASGPFEIYFGTQGNPPLVATNVAETSFRVNALQPSTTYRWQVVANNVNGGKVTSPTRSFTTRACAAPSAPSIIFAPNTVTAGVTYAIVWTQAAGLDADGAYLVERSSSSSFTNVESQITTSTAATFVAASPGTYYHRVSALPSCDPTKSSNPSAVHTTTISAARPNVIFTTQPVAAVAAIGARLEELRGSFTLENISSAPIRIAIGRQEINSSPPFFTVVDPQGGDIFITLQPRTPRTFELRYAGPRSDVAGSYQGVIYVAGEGLPVIPYAFVDLRIGEGEGSAPQFVVEGVPAEYLAFPGLTGDDTGRAPLQVTIRNNGSAPMEMAAEIGPEVWLIPERGWNAGRVEPGASRVINLTTRRALAPNGSALPRYTYFTVRTKGGGSARLLVQDNEAVQSTRGRSIALPPSQRSFIVPEVTSRLSPGLVATRLRLTNAGSEAVQLELLFTPAATDGFDATNVKKATVVAPPNDVVTLIDPLVQLFALQRPASGQLEIRVAPERLGLISATASTVAFNTGRSVTIPVLNRGHGAKRDFLHTVYGVTETGAVTSTLVLAETTGLDGATVRATLFDAGGARIGSATYDLQRYGYRRIDNIVTALGGASLEYGRVDLAVESGGGTVGGLAIVRERASESGATFVSRSSNAESGSARVLGSPLARLVEPNNGTPSVTTVVPVLGKPSSTGASPSYRTAISLISIPAGAADFKLIFKGADGSTLLSSDTIRVPAGTSVVFKDAVRDFNVPSLLSGSVRIDASNGGKVSAVLQSLATPSSAPAPASVLPLPTTVSELLTGGAPTQQRPLLFDGLEQSTDASRGSRWILVLNEVAGTSGQVKIRLYEAGNRTVPIAEKDVNVEAYQQVSLDTLFGTLGLEAPDRRKDRTNVQVVVTGVSGSARIAASAVSVDNQTGETKVHSLTPGVGSATPGASLVTAVVPPPTAPAKRRAVRH